MQGVAKDFSGRSAGTRTQLPPSAPERVAEKESPLFAATNTRHEMVSAVKKCLSASISKHETSFEDKHSQQKTVRRCNFTLVEWNIGLVEGLE